MRGCPLIVPLKRIHAASNELAKQQDRSIIVIINSVLCSDEPVTRARKHQRGEIFNHKTEGEMYDVFVLPSTHLVEPGYIEPFTARIDSL